MSGAASEKTGKGTHYTLAGKGLTKGSSNTEERKGSQRAQPAKAGTRDAGRTRDKKRRKQT